MKHFLVSIIAIAFTLSATAKDDIIIKLKKGTNPATFELKNKVKLTAVAPAIGLYSAQPNKISTIPGKIITANRFSRSNDVEYAHRNHSVNLRRATKMPNDPEFNKHWNMLLDETNFGIDAVSAWEQFGTGGTDPAGNEIVIAVVDGGFDISHPDLINNLWVNKGEIAGNNIDDDGNGYVDDLNGWNAEDNTGNILVDYHGTHVSGIAGAQGDNGLFGAGVNWKIKIMYVSAGWSLADTATTMSAYSYILEQKKLWIKSGGLQGANVVAINSSFGIDGADCNSPEYTEWNDMFNELGKSGILSVAATANRDFHIDKTGDVPTACDSPFVVAVTNSDINGKKVKNAGYGIMTIDLAAPGDGVYSTYPDKSFDISGGTSMATPHVTGAAAYLHSTASAKFNNLYLSDPAKAALELKDILMKTVTKQEGMKDISMSSGILNINQASQLISNY